MSQIASACPALLSAVNDVLQWMEEAETETGKPMGDGLGYRAKIQKPVIVEKLKTAREIALKAMDSTV